MSARRVRATGLGIGLAVLFAAAAGADVELEGAARHEGLWCFPRSAEGGGGASYLYLPSQARLVEDDAGGPAFSMLRYVEVAESEATEDSVTEAGGGAVVHFLVTYDTPPDQLLRAAKALRRETGEPEAVLAGPVVFDRASYTVVSSTLRRGRDDADWSWLSSGQASVLEGGRVALSFDLTPAAARLLMESLRSTTSDVSVVFDLSFRALSPAYDARVVVDWSEVRKHRGFSAGASYAFVGAEIDLLFDELLRDGAIRLESAGSDAGTEALLDRVYARLLELMFAPVEPEEMSDGERGGLLDALTALAGAGSAGGVRKAVGYGADVGYRVKDVATEGRTVLTFSHRAPVERHHLLTVNLGDLYARYGEDGRRFRTVHLGDPAYRQREVHVAVDGSLLPEFDDLLNHVAVTLRKRHAGGGETLRELVLHRDKLADGAPALRLIYGWDGDDDRSRWLEYEVKLRWSFKGGLGYDTPWQMRSSPAIVLDTPYERREVMLLGDGEALRAAGVRAVTVEVETPFFGERRREQRVFRIDGGPIDERLEIVLPRGEHGYDYRIVWTLSGGETRDREASDDRGALFLDELPPAPRAAAAGRMDG